MKHSSSLKIIILLYFVIAVISFSHHAIGLEEILTEEVEETQEIQSKEISDLSPTEKYLPEEVQPTTEPKGLFEILFGTPQDSGKEEADKANEYTQRESILEENYSGNFLNTALLKVIDRTIGKLYKIQIPVGTRKQMGNISIKIKSCWDPLEKTIIPQSRALLEIYELVNNSTNSPSKNNLMFYGWVIASHPAVSFVNHPVYDISLSECVDMQKTAPKKEVTEKNKIPVKEDKQEN